MLYRKEKMMKESIDAYLKLGFSLIPLAYKGKKPSTSWKEFQERHASAEERSVWFGDFTLTNVGIVTGRISGIVVLDVDGEEGEASLSTLGALPITPRVVTGRGRHLYFKHPGTFVGNPVNRLPGLDVRGDGGYVVAPPSIHPDGSVYEWALHPSEVPFAELPERLIELLKMSKGDQGVSVSALELKE